MLAVLSLFVLRNLGGDSGRLDELQVDAQLHVVADNDPAHLDWGAPREPEVLPVQAPLEGEAGPQQPTAAQLVGQRPDQAALDHLLAQGFARPERKGRGVRQVRLLMRIEEGSRWERIITFRDPAIDHRAAAAAIAPQLEGLTLSGAVEEMAIVLQEFAAEVGRQEGLFPEKGKRLRQLAGSLKQLKAQYQRPLLARVVEVEPWSRIPENRMALIDYDP